MAPPLLGRFGAKWKSPQTSPIDSHVKSIFFHKTELSMYSLWLPGGLAPPCRVISSGRKSLYERHTASTEAYSVKMAALSSAITQFALWQKLLFSQRTNEDKLTTKQLGLPRPNVSIHQVSSKGGKSYIQELERKKIAWLMRSVFHIPLSLFIGFTVCFTVRFLH